MLRQHIGAQGDDRRVGIGTARGADRPGRLIAVRSRHLQVHEHQIEGLLRGQGHGLVAALGDDHGLAGGFQHGADQFPVHGHVVHHQDLTARPPRAGASLDPRVSGRDGQGLRGDLEAEGRPLAKLRFHRDPAAHEAHQLGADGQAEPGAPVAAVGGPVQLREALEQLAQLVPRNSEPRVADGHGELLRLRIEGRDDRDSAPVRELQGIADEIDHHLPQTAPVPHGLVALRRMDLQVQGQAPARGDLGEHGQGVLELRLQIEGGGAQLDLSGLHPGEVEDVVDQGQQGVAAGGDAVDVGPRLVPDRRVALQEPGKADDRGQRRADLVAHVGQEFGLGRRGRLGAELGLDQVVLQHPTGRHVPIAGDGAALPRLGIADQGGVALQPAIGPVPTADPVFAADVLVDGSACEQAAEDLLRPLHVVGMHEVDGGAADQVRLLIAIGADGGGHVADLAIAAEPDHHVGPVVGDHPEAGLALLQGLLPAAGVGDVHDHAEDRDDLPVLVPLEGPVGRHVPPLALGGENRRLDAVGSAIDDGVQHHLAQPVPVFRGIDGDQVVLGHFLHMAGHPQDAGGPAAQDKDLPHGIEPPVADPGQFLGQFRQPGAGGHGLFRPVGPGRLAPEPLEIAVQVEEQRAQHPQDQRAARQGRQDHPRRAVAHLGQSRGDLDQRQQAQGRDQVDQQPTGPGIVLHQGPEHQHAQQGHAEGLGRAGVEIEEEARREGESQIDQPGGDGAHPAVAGGLGLTRAAEALLHEIEDGHAGKPCPGERRSDHRKGGDEHDGGVEQAGGLQSGGGVKSLSQKGKEPLGNWVGHRRREPVGCEWPYLRRAGSSASQVLAAVAVLSIPALPNRLNNRLIFPAGPGQRAHSGTGCGRIINFHRRWL